MKVTLEFNGVMENYYPDKQVDVSVPESATLADLFQCIGRLKPALPESIWHYGENRFRGPVLITSDGRVLRDKNEKLYTGQLVRLRRVLMGG